jgi:pimeloyl-ACP methyl ester carboxylesterase
MTELDAVRHVVTLNGAALCYQTHGTGEPLLLLHGGGGVADNWRLVFDFAPPAGYQLIVPDLRGHGQSTNPSRRITFRQLADDVIALLDHLSISSAYMIGVSMGAKTLLHVATGFPTRVRRMVLVSAAPFFPEPTRAAMRAAAASVRSDADWALMRRWHSHGDDQIRALWNLGATLADDYEDLNFTPSQLGTIAAPTLIVHGDRDWLYPIGLAMELHSAIRNSHLWVVPNGGHGPIFGPMAPSFAETAVGFLNGAWAA